MTKYKIYLILRNKLLLLHMEDFKSFNFYLNLKYIKILNISKILIKISSLLVKEMDVGDKPRRKISQNIKEGQICHLQH